MFDFLDWGRHMEMTTNELAGVNPFMAYGAGVFFVLAALMGGHMLYRVFQNKENDMFLTLLHFVSGATVFALLIMQLVAGSASGDPMSPEESGMLPRALLLSGMMLLLGGFIWRQRLRKKRWTGLIYAHVLTGLLTAYVLFAALLEL